LRISLALRSSRTWINRVRVIDSWL
jgi:hypothetical protein